MLSFAASGGNWDAANDNDYGTVNFGPLVNVNFFTLDGDIQDAYRMGWLTFSYEIIATTNPTRLQFTSIVNQCIQVGLSQCMCIYILQTQAPPFTYRLTLSLCAPKHVCSS